MKIYDAFALAAAAIAPNGGRPATTLVHDSGDARVVLFRLEPGQAVSVHTSSSTVVVGGPVLRRIEAPPLRQRLFQELGSRFRRTGWFAIAVLLTTGVFNLYFRGWLHWSGVLGLRCESGLRSSRA